jgi:hypothetical protein
MTNLDKDEYIKLQGFMRAGGYSASISANDSIRFLMSIIEQCTCEHCGTRAPIKSYRTPYQPN